MEECDNQISVEEYDSGIQQHEDAALKTTMQFFAEELLPYLGIEGQVVSYGPTELVHLELKKLFQDFNLVMADGAWKHFEFQSTNGGLEDLKRFRTYEAIASYQHKVAISTYVLYSGTIKNPMTEFTEGLNTYRVYPIIMQDKDGDELIRQLQEKVERGESLSKDDLVPLTLCPLMGGKMSQKERIQSAFSITRNACSIDPQIIRKIEAVVYAMADKFLDDKDMDELREEIKMTRLGRMLVNDGIAQGIEIGLQRGISQGITQGITQGAIMERMDLVKKKLQRGKTIEEIADALEESVENVRELIAKIYED